MPGDNKQVVVPKRIQKEIYKYFYAIGLITDEDLKDPSTLEKKIDQILIESNHSFNTVVDYRSYILKEAETFIELEKFDFALVFFVMYIEHELNNILINKMILNNNKDKTIKAVIRTSNIEAKLTWIIELLNLPPLNEKYIKILMKANETRNSIIHYKWRFDPKNKISVDDIIDLKKSIHYLKTYERRILLKGNSKRIDELMK